MRGRFPLRPAVAAMTAVAGLAGVLAFLPPAAAGQAPTRQEHAGPGTAAAAAAPLPGPRGIFVLVPADSAAIPSALLSASYVNGFIFSRNWNTVERTHGRFSWKPYERIVKAAQTHGKQVILGVRPGLVGDGLPTWLHVPTFHCTEDSDYGPVEWNSTYTAQFKTVVSALIGRFNSAPAVAGYAVGGFYQWLTDDFSLCTGTAADRMQWLTAKYGYTRQKIMNSMLSIYGLVTSKTTKQIRMPVAGMLDEATGGVDTASTAAYVIDPAYQSFGTGVIRIGRTIFDQNTGDPLHRYNNNPVGPQFQLILDRCPYIWGQRRPASQGGPGTAQQWATTLGIVLDYGIQWFEIGINEAENPAFQKAFAQANTAMIDGTDPCPG